MILTMVLTTELFIVSLAYCQTDSRKITIQVLLEKAYTLEQRARFIQNLTFKAFRFWGLPWSPLIFADGTSLINLGMLPYPVVGCASQLLKGGVINILYPSNIWNTPSFTH